jgi:N-acetylglucosamine-6-phosphate deacetylase
VTVVTGSGALTLPGASLTTPCWVRIEGDRIAGAGVGPPPRGAPVVETEGVLAPGFVDLQVNGTGAVDFGSSAPERWCEALEAMARHGVTACLPTLVSRPLDAYGAPLEVAARAVSDPPPQAAVPLGVHLEGPFLGGRPGAHDPDALRPADPAWLARVLDDHGALVRVVTLAPEADPGLAATRLLAGRGVVVAVGHTDASYDEVRAAAAAGARMATHLFNAMAPLHHREPGPVAAALECLVPSVIADLVHVHPAVLRLVARAAARVVLVTDQVAGTGLAGDGRVHRRPDGTLAGSATPMDVAVLHLVEIGLSLAAAVDMAATAPADLLGDRERGRLEPGRRADVVVLERRTGALEAVFAGGARVK